MAKKLTYEYIKEYIEIHKYKLLSTEYKNSKTKLKLLCPEGHIYKVLFYHFKIYKCRCSECSIFKKKTIEDIKENALLDGTICTSDFYINSVKNLNFICPNKHEYKMCWKNFQQGQRCRQCYEKNIIGKNHPRFKEDRTRQTRVEYLKFTHNKIKILSDEPNYNDYLINKNFYQVDHIFPRIAFIDNNLDKIYNQTVIKEICNLRENLRIIPYKDNGSKGSKYNQEKFMNWFYNKLKEVNFERNK